MSEFKISSFCSYGGCVEVGRSSEGSVVMRDTKDRGHGSLSFTDEEWTAFIAVVKAGEFDLV